ncbi:MAG: (d)CMP kinase [Acidobacteriota bacterium]
MMQAPLIIAIDGPSGVGKSTVARLLARRLRVPMLNTGAMYRTVALDALESGLDPEDRKEIRRRLKDLDLDLRPDGDGGIEVLLKGEPVGGRIRTPEVSKAASIVSAHSAVRKRMVEIQRRFGQRGGGVLEGRDIGTVVFPDTPFKFFLDARADVRAERRYRELVAAGRGSTQEEVLKDLEERDQRDRKRQDSPLTVTDEHFQIDTSDLLPPEIVERMVGVIRTKQVREDAGADAADPADDVDPSDGSDGAS